MDVDYSKITEGPGLRVTQEQIERIYQRYRFAKPYAREKNVLEVGCGCGLGLTYLSSVASRVVGGDISEKNVVIAKKCCNKACNIRRDNVGQNKNIHLGIMDAHYLPLRDQSFDLVLLYEAIYYLKNPLRFVREAKRILRESGYLIVCTVNRDWEDFHPSDYANRYFSVPELCELLGTEFEKVEMYGGFRIERMRNRDRLISLIKRLAVKLDLIPGSLEARAYLKRLFMGKLVPLPWVIYDGIVPYKEPFPIPSNSKTSAYKIIYAVGKI